MSLKNYINFPWHVSLQNISLAAERPMSEDRHLCHFQQYQTERVQGVWARI